MRELTPRMSLIIDYIVLNEKISIKNIAEELGLSIRQVRYNIEKINVLFESTQNRRCMIETNNKGDIVITNIPALRNFQAIENSNFKNTKEERISLLMVISAFNIKRLNLNALSRILNVSRTTLKNDLEQLQKTLSNYHIVLQYKDKNFCLAGTYTEKELFLFRLSTIHPLEHMLYKETESVIDHLIYAYVVNEKMNSVKPRFLLPLIKEFFLTNDIYMKDSEFYWFCKVMYVCVWYSVNNIPTPFHEQEISTYYDIDPVIKLVEEHYNIKFTEASKYFFISLIATLNQNENKAYRNIDRIIISFILQLMLYLDSNDVNPHFYKDETLLYNLYWHLNSYIKKHDISMSRDVYPILEAIEPLDHLLQKFYDDKKTLIDLTNIQEQAFIKLYFLSSLNRNHMYLKKKALIISGVSQPIRKELKATLEQLFEIQIVDVISRFDIPFYEQIPTVDFLLFTEEAPIEYCKRYNVIHIHPIINEGDIVHLLESGLIARKNIQEQVSYVSTQFELLENAQIQYATISIDKNMLSLLDNVYITYQLTDKQRAQITIDSHKKCMLLHLCHKNAIDLINMIFQYYDQLKDQELINAFFKEMKTDF